MKSAALSQPVAILAGYVFKPLDAATYQEHAQRLREFGQSCSLRGLVLLGPEGYNMTVCGAESRLREWVALFESWGCHGISWKWSYAQKLVFPRFKVKIKREIVSLGRPGWTPPPKTASHLSPAEVHALLQSPETVVLDTRNTYEAQVGKFKRAIVPPIDHFSEFPQYLQQSNLPRDKKVLIYCTGGIRCEKAIVEMRQQGFQDVVQLDGGILNYFEALPQEEVDKTWEGECFVFDHRVSVTPDLAPSQRYGLCPHCGDPADEAICCEDCDRPTKICSSCKALHATCSKHCRERVRRSQGGAHSTRPVHRRKSRPDIPISPD